VIPAALFPLHAQGDVPGWVLVADRTAMALTRADGVTAVAGAPLARITPGGLALFAAPDMNLILTRGICTDAAARVPYPFTAAFGMPGTELNGCAGDPLVVLAGDWTVDLVAGVAMPEDDVVTMRFAGAAVAGFAGCNEYAAQIAPDDAGLSFAPPVATRMACAAPLMGLEAAFLGAVPRVTHVAVNANGELELRDDTTLLIRAYR
jgi:heat shock protein HslJ